MSLSLQVLLASCLLGACLALPIVHLQEEAKDLKDAESVGAELVAAHKPIFFGPCDAEHCPLFTIMEQTPEFAVREYSGSHWMSTIVQVNDQRAPDLASGIAAAQTEGVFRLRNAIANIMDQSALVATSESDTNKAQMLIPVIKVRVIPDLNGGLTPTFQVSMFMPAALPRDIQPEMVDPSCFPMYEPAHFSYASAFTSPSPSSPSPSTPAILDKDVQQQGLTMARELRRSNLSHADAFFEFATYVRGNGDVLHELLFHGPEYMDIAMD